MRTFISFILAIVMLCVFIISFIKMFNTNSFDSADATLVIICLSGLIQIIKEKDDK